VDIQCRMRWCGTGGHHRHTGSEWWMMTMMIEMAYCRKGGIMVASMNLQSSNRLTLSVVLCVGEVSVIAWA